MGPVSVDRSDGKVTTRFLLRCSGSGTHSAAAAGAHRTPATNVQSDLSP